MKRTKSTLNSNPKTPGFAILLTDETELGTAMLIAEDDDGGYLPISTVSTIGEAREIAQDDFLRRIDELERGGEPFCPAAYKVWARGLDGVLAVAAEFDAITL